jgi:hypothetical protein
LLLLLLLLLLAAAAAAAAAAAFYLLPSTPPPRVAGGLTLIRAVLLLETVAGTSYISLTNCQQGTLTSATKLRKFGFIIESSSLENP